MLETHEVRATKFVVQTNFSWERHLSKDPFNRRFRRVRICRGLLLEGQIGFGKQVYELIEVTTLVTILVDQDSVLKTQSQLWTNWPVTKWHPAEGANRVEKLSDRNETHSYRILGKCDTICVITQTLHQVNKRTCLSYSVRPTDHFLGQSRIDAKSLGATCSVRPTINSLLRHNTMQRLLEAFLKRSCRS